MGRFFNVDPLSEKYAYQSHYNFSENRMLDGRELEGLERVGHDWSGYDFKGDPDSQRNSAIQNHEDKVNDKVTNVPTNNTTNHTNIDEKYSPNVVNDVKQVIPTN